MCAIVVLALHIDVEVIFTKTLILFYFSIIIHIEKLEYFVYAIKIYKILLKLLIGSQQGHNALYVGYRVYCVINESFEY